MSEAAVARTERGKKNRFQILFSEESGKCGAKDQLRAEGKDLSPQQNLPFLEPLRASLLGAAPKALHPPDRPKGGVVVSPGRIHRPWTAGLGARADSL